MHPYKEHHNQSRIQVSYFVMGSSGEIQLQYLNGVARTQARNFGELQTICHRNLARWPWFVLPGERDASGAASNGPKPWVYTN